VSLVTLLAPDIGLFSRFVQTRIELPQLDEQEPMNRVDKVPVLFDGSTRPVAYRGELEEQEWQLSVTFTPAEQDVCVALLDLFRDAHRAADSRLQLRTFGARTAGLDDVNVVEVDEWTPVRVEGGAVEVRFHAFAVEWSLDELSEALITWDDVIAAYATWDDLIAAFDTWDDLLAARSLP
jgi:hypothetical protein